MAPAISLSSAALRSAAAERSTPPYIGASSIRAWGAAGPPAAQPASHKTGMNKMDLAV
ncbi:hypothetical protein ADE_12190 [Achromobacter denitrificans]|nr:hypothetical protein ADE_12190 [Achromobacter denitrificans]